jgi:hypothetical protein
VQPDQPVKADLGRLRDHCRTWRRSPGIPCRCLPGRTAINRNRRSSQGMGRSNIVVSNAGIEAPFEDSMADSLPLSVWRRLLTPT